MRPRARLIMVEAKARKTAFLREAVRTLDLPATNSMHDLRCISEPFLFGIRKVFLHYGTDYRRGHSYCFVGHVLGVWFHIVLPCNQPIIEEQVWIAEVHAGAGWQLSDKRPQIYLTSI